MFVNCQLQVGRSNLYTTERKLSAEHIFPLSPHIFYKRVHTKRVTARYISIASENLRVFEILLLSSAIKEHPSLTNPHDLGDKLEYPQIYNVEQRYVHLHHQSSKPVPR